MDDEAVRALEAEVTDLRRRSRAQIRDLARQVHPQLDPVAYPLMVQLWRCDAVRIGDLGVALGLDKSTVSRQVDAVVRLGLARRLPDPGDARARLVTLTEDGRDRVTGTHGVVLTRWRASLESWSVHDVRQLADLLHRLGQTGLG